jgi:hypothetical protein
MPAEQDDMKCEACGGTEFLQRLTLHRDVEFDRQIVKHPPEREGDPEKPELVETPYVTGASPWNIQTYQCADCGAVVQVVPRQRMLQSGVSRIEAELQTVKLSQRVETELKTVKAAKRKVR